MRIAPRVSIAGALTPTIVEASPSECMKTPFSPPSRVAAVCQRKWQELSAANPALGSAAEQGNRAGESILTTVTHRTPKSENLAQLRTQHPLPPLERAYRQTARRIYPPSNQRVHQRTNPVIPQAQRRSTPFRQPSFRLRRQFHALQQAPRPSQLKPCSKQIRMALTTTFSCIKLLPCSGSHHPFIVTKICSMGSGSCITTELPTSSFTWAKIPRMVTSMAWSTLLPSSPNR